MKVSLRVIVVALVAAVVGFVAAAGLVRLMVLRNNAGAASSLRAAMTEEHVTRCEGAPDRWSFELELGARTFAYDTSWTPSNAGAPRLPLAPAQVPSPVGATVRVPRSSEHGPIVAVRVREAGPCAVVAAHFNAPPQRQDPTLPSAIALALVTATTAALGFLAIVRPFARRVEELRRVAERVGEEDYPESDAPSLGENTDDELGRIRRGLDVAHRRIVDANEALRRRLAGLEEHLANVAHDVRTPLASLQAQIEEALDTEDVAVTRSRLGGALEDCVYVAGLTDNLRLASRLAEGFDPTKGSADLTSVVGRIVTRLGYLARRRGVSLEHSVPEHPLVVRCDPIAIEQAVGNVIENAILHLREGEHIGVVLDRTAAERFRLSIVDDGPGVEPDAIARLGERTFRTDAARGRDPRGSGLGLAITRTVCEKVGFGLSFDARGAEAGGVRGLEVTIEGDLDDEESRRRRRG